MLRFLTGSFPGRRQEAIENLVQRPRPAPFCPVDVDRWDGHKFGGANCRILRFRDRL